MKSEDQKIGISAAAPQAPEPAQPSQHPQTTQPAEPPKEEEKIVLNEGHADNSTTHLGTAKQELGYVVDVDRYIVSVSGLPNAKINELVTSPTGARGIINSLTEDLVEILMLDSEKIKPKDTFKRTGQQYSVVAGDHLLGRTINPLGIPIDGKERLPTLNVNASFDINQIAPDITTREFITEQFVTGISTVDMLVPIAKGQRQLLIGDARSGKTSFIINTIINQKKLSKDPVICIYALIGKPINEIKNLIEVLNANQAMDHTIIVATSSADMATLIYYTPYVAITLAEYFERKGKDVLLIWDDVGIHAKYYREISLLGNKPPGRQSYPGDIFYQHARLVERAGNFNAHAGGGSITALPLIETNLDDLTGFISTNLMAMTDGHIIFDSSLYHRGRKPAIDIFVSVSRVGRQTQGLIQKLLSDKIKSTLVQAKKLETFSSLGSEVSPETQRTLNQGKQIEILLNQIPLTHLPVLSQMILLSLVFTDFFAAQSPEVVELNKQNLISFVVQKGEDAALQKAIPTTKELDQFLHYVAQLSEQLKPIWKGATPTK